MNAHKTRPSRNKGSNSSKLRNEQVKRKAKDEDNEETLALKTTQRKKRKGGTREDVKGEKDTDKKEEEEHKPKIKPLREAPEPEHTNSAEREAGNVEVGRYCKCFSNKKPVEEQLNDREDWELLRHMCWAKAGDYFPTVRGLVEYTERDGRRKVVRIIQ